MNDTMQMNDTVFAEIDIDASPERVFEAWTDPEQRIAWWGDDAMYRSTKMESDLRVGGKWRTEGLSRGNKFVVWGEYTRVDPPKALGFTWNHDYGETGLPATHVLVELSPTSTGTHVSLTHSGFSSATDRDSHNQGWQWVLGWLKNYVQR
jgi:uncharacterized protein YndB with AHSA1/START domain